ncbi:M23 family metallopeptidase [Isoptericola halotolerans]|uniref:peptidoglycan DD-metalloendopeptidase family protein n=1 Tax=Isoptericola halotolerans TaxID=300560 RepID=UPI00388DA6C8
MVVHRASPSTARPTRGVVPGDRCHGGAMLSHPSPRTPRRPVGPALATAVSTLLVTTALVLTGAGAGRALDVSRDASWHAPVGGAVVRAFDPPAQPWLPGHRGVDLTAPPGTPVTAPAAGTVTFAGPVGGKPVVVVSHGSLRSTLEPVEAWRTVGDRVARGDVVGVTTDDTVTHHCVATACLHWGVRRGEAYLDPLVLLGRAVPVVLLPQSAG